MKKTIDRMKYLQADNPKISTIYVIRELLGFRFLTSTGGDEREQLCYGKSDHPLLFVSQLRVT